jgi:hypothetical protein
MEMLGERGNGAVAIIDHRVVVVRQGDRQEDVDAEAVRGLG